MEEMFKESQGRRVKSNDELRWEMIEKMKDVDDGHHCPWTTCPEYMQQPLCANHAHVLCPDYIDEKLNYQASVGYHDNGERKNG